MVEENRVLDAGLVAVALGGVLAGLAVRQLLHREHSAFISIVKELMLAELLLLMLVSLGELRASIVTIGIDLSPVVARSRVVVRLGSCLMHEQVVLVFDVLGDILGRG